MQQSANEHDNAFNGQPKAKEGSGADVKTPLVAKAESREQKILRLKIILRSLTKFVLWFVAAASPLERMPATRYCFHLFLFPLAAITFITSFFLRRYYFQVISDESHEWTISNTLLIRVPIAIVETYTFIWLIYNLKFVPLWIIALQLFLIHVILFIYDCCLPGSQTSLYAFIGVVVVTIIVILMTMASSSLLGNMIVFLFAVMAGVYGWISFWAYFNKREEIRIVEEDIQKEKAQHHSEPPAAAPVVVVSQPADNRPASTEATHPPTASTRPTDSKN